MTVDIEMEGGEALAGKLRELPEKVARKFMADALRAAAEPVLAACQHRCPHKSMDLLSGLHVSVRSRGQETVASVSNDPKDYYAIMGERGSKGPGRRFQPARPFMGPGLEAAAEDALDIAAASLKEDIEEEMNEL